MYEHFLSRCSLCSHLNALTFSPLYGGSSEGLGVFIFSLNLHVEYLYTDDDGHVLYVPGMYYVWSSHITEYGSTRQGSQSFSWLLAEQRENYYSGVFAFPRSRLRICLGCEGFDCRLVPRQPGYSPYSGNSNGTRSPFGYVFSKETRSSAQLILIIRAQ